MCVSSQLLTTNVNCHIVVVLVFIINWVHMEKGFVPLKSVEKFMNHSTGFMNPLLKSF